MSTRINRHYLVIICCSIFILLLFGFRNLIIDDSYITFTYAKNFATVFKPWYNLDPEFQGNGQTSLLWMCVLAILQWIGIRPEISFYLLNGLLGCFLIWRFITSVSYREDKDVAGIIFYIAVICYFTYWLALNSSHGLETILAAIILLQFLYNWDKTKNYYAIFLVLIRPEFAVFNILWILKAEFFSKDFFQRAGISALGIVIFASYYLLFFDFYIPLPLLLKSSISNYSIAGLKVFIGYLVLFSPVIYQYLKQRKYLEMAPLVFLLFYYNFNINSYSSGIYLRYLFPLFIFFLFIKIEREWKMQFFMVISLLRMADLSINFYEDTLGVADDNRGFRQSYAKIADSMTTRDKILVFDAGYTAYFSKGLCYDGLGLNDATLLMAVKNGDCSIYEGFVRRKKINYITIASTSRNRLIPRSETEKFVSECLSLKNPNKVYPLYSGCYLLVYYMNYD